MIHALLLLVPASNAPTAAPDTSPIDDPALVQSAPDPEKLNKWTGSVSAGVIVTDGNTETTSASMTADAEKRRERDRTTFGLWWNYQDEVDQATDDKDVVQRRYGAKAQYDYFFTKKTYGLAQANAESDLESDLDLRWTAGVGIGRQLHEDEKLKFAVEGGLSWVDEDYDRQPGQPDPDKEYLAARLAEKLDWNFRKGWELGHNGEVYPSLEDSKDVHSKVDTRLKVALTSKLFAQLQWVWDWNNNPPSGNHHNDHRYLLTLGWSF
jgi:putative salt-induced outer membrane protein YdiY